MIIYKNGEKIASHVDAPSHNVDPVLSEVSPGTFQNSNGPIDDQGEQAKMFVLNIKKLTGYNVPVSEVDVDHLGSCNYTAPDGTFFESIESLRRAQ